MQNVPPIMALSGVTPITAGNGIEQFLRIGMAGIVKYVDRFSVFDNFTPLHDSDRIANLGGDPKIMGDEKHGKLKTFANVGEQAQYLRLHGDVQSRHSFVGDDDLRL
jgi:hypothetical protein